MGCVLSYFKHGTLTLPEGQLTDKLLEGDISEEHSPAESAEQKRGAAAATSQNRDTSAAGGDQAQDDAPDEPSDDDKALLLGALGATAAGAVTIGAVAGALKIAQIREEALKADQEQNDQLTEPAQDTAEIVPDKRETPSAQERTGSSSDGQDGVESPITAPGTASPEAAGEVPGDGGAATGLAVVAGAGGVVTAAALAGDALQSEDDTTREAAFSDLQQGSGSEAEEEIGEVTKSERKDSPADLAAEDTAVEESQMSLPGTEREYMSPATPGSEHLDVLKPSEAAKSPAGSVDGLSSESRDHTPVQSLPAVSASPDDSVFDGKRPESQQKSPAEGSQSPAERQPSPAPHTSADEYSHAESEIRPVSDTLGGEALSARLPEPPSTSPDSGKDDEPFHVSSPAIESPMRTVAEPDVAEIHTPGEESDAPFTTDKDNVTSEAQLEVSGGQSKTDDDVDEGLTLAIAADRSLVHSEVSQEDSLAGLRSSARVDNKEALTMDAENVQDTQGPTKFESPIQPTDDIGEQPDVQTLTVDDDTQEASQEDSLTRSSARVDNKEALTMDATNVQDTLGPTEFESPIQPTDVEEQPDVQTLTVDDDIHVSSTTPVEKPGDQSKDVLAYYIQSSSEHQDNAKPYAGDESKSSPAGEEGKEVESPPIEGDSHIHSPETDADELQASEPKDDTLAEPTIESDHPSELVAEAPRIQSFDTSPPGTAKDHSDADSVKRSDHGEEGDQPVVSDATSIMASADTHERESPEEGDNREEVETPKIVPAKSLNQQATPEDEKFMSILVSPKGVRQPNVEQIDDKDSKQTANAEQEGQISSKSDTDAKSEGSSSSLQKHEDEDENRVESSAEAVCGSATDLQEKMDCVQSPVHSVKEEPVVKVDRFSTDSDADSAPATSHKDNLPDDVNVITAPTPSAISDGKDAADSQLDTVPALSETELSRDVDQKESESDVSGAELSSSRNAAAAPAFSEEILERGISPDKVSNKNESQRLQADMDIAKTENLGVSPTSVGAAEDNEMVLDVSDQTEDYDFDPLAKTQSFVFPDELAGRSSQFSEKPSSPFPELEESDTPDVTATASTPEINQTMEATVKETREASEAGAEESTSLSNAEVAPPTTEKTTPINEEVASEESSTPPAAEATPEAHNPATPGADKKSDKSQVDTTEREISAQQTEQINVEKTSSESPEDPPQSAAAEEADSPQNPRPAEQPPPEVEEAATKIQAGVRGWQARRKISRQQAAATQIQAGFRGWRVRRGRRMRRTSSLPVLSKTEPSTSSDQYMDVDTLKDRAAAKIQAGFRGWRTRQEMRSLAATSPLEEAPRVSPAISMTEISAEDQAAARIQAGFRGWKTRRTLKRSLSDPNSEALVLAEGQQPKRVAESGAGSSGPQPIVVDDRLTTSVEAATPRDEDETAHSIQSIQSEIASTSDSPRQDANVLFAKPSVTELIPAIPHIEELSETHPSATDSSTIEPSSEPPSVSDPSHADRCTSDPPAAPLSLADESQQEEAATRIQAGYRGWKTRQQMRADPADEDSESAAVRPTVSAKSVTDSGALPIDFAIVHRPEDDWLTQDLMKIEAEKRAAGGEAAAEQKTNEKLVASASDEPDSKEGKDARPDSTSTTESSSSWLAHAQTEIRASFQGLRDNVSDALKTVEDTARLVQEKGAAAAGADGGADAEEVVVAEGGKRVTESGAGAVEGPQGSSDEAMETLVAPNPDGQIGKEDDVSTSAKSPSEREEEEIWEEIQRSMRHED